ncbi:unnamed protein product, partial [Medioppia subpectinata]
VRQNWHECRIEGKFPATGALTDELTVILVTVTEPTEVELCLYQSGHRSSAHDSHSHHKLDLFVAVFGFNGLVGRLVCESKRQVKSFVSCHEILEPGVYAVVTMAFNHWHNGVRDCPPYLLAIHSSKVMLTERVSPPRYIIADCLIGLALARGRKHECSEGITAYYLTKHWSGLVVMVENRHPTTYAQVICNCMDSVNVVSTRSTLKTADSIPPLHRQIVIVLTHLEGTGGMIIHYQLTNRGTHHKGLNDWGNNGGVGGLEGSRDSEHIPVLDNSVRELHSPRPL